MTEQEILPMIAKCDEPVNVNAINVPQMRDARTVMKKLIRKIRHNAFRTHDKFQRFQAQRRVTQLKRIVADLELVIQMAP